MGLFKSIANCINHRPTIFRKTSISRVAVQTKVTPARVTQVCTTFKTASIATAMLSNPAEEPSQDGMKDTARMMPPARSADPMQMRLIDDLYKVLEAVSVGSCDVKEVQATFRQDLRLAAKASVFDFWPLPKDDTASSSQPLTTYQLSSILDQAINSSRLPETLDLLLFLLKALPSRSTYDCPELLELLDLLANISRDRATPYICRDQLQQMLRSWVQPVQQALAKLAPVQLPAIGNADVSTDSQQQSPTLVSIPHWLSDEAGSYIEEQPFFEQMAPYVWTPPPGYIEVVEKDDLSPTVQEAYQLVESSIPSVPAEELSPNPIWSKHRHLLGKIGGGPHGPVAIKAYLKRKSSNIYLFDFNEQRLQRIRLEKSQEKKGSVPPFGTDQILSVGFDAGFMAADNDDIKDDQADAGDCYI